jgi:hypothetical protein
MQLTAEQDHMAVQEEELFLPCACFASVVTTEQNFFLNFSEICFRRRQVTKRRHVRRGTVTLFENMEGRMNELKKLQQT